VADRLSVSAKGYYLARAASARAILEVRGEPVKSYDALTDRWSDNDKVFKNARFGNGTYSVIAFPETAKLDESAKYGLSDEERKININLSPANILKNLFEIASGIDAEESESIAYSIINWRSPAQAARKEGAGAFYYQALDHPYDCKNAPIEDLEELLLVKGVTRDVFDKTKKFLTVYGSGAVNINTSDGIVLRSLGMSEGLTAKVLRFRDNAGKSDGTADSVFDDTSKIATLLTKESISAEESGKINSLIAARLLSVNSDNFSGVAIGKVGDGINARSARIDFVFDRKNNAIRYWREGY
jgi:general secretion pathway protein K